MGISLKVMVFKICLMEGLVTDDVRLGFEDGRGSEDGKVDAFGQLSGMYLN